MFIFFKRNDNCIFLGIIPSFKLMVFSCRQTICFQQHLNAGTRNIKQFARSCSLDISETSRIKDMLGLLSLYFDKPLILINRQLDKQTKQMVCGYALGHYLEHQLLMDLHTLNKFLTIKDPKVHRLL